MPNVGDYSSESDWMGACVPKMMQDKGMPQEQAVAACMNMWAHKGDKLALEQIERDLGLLPALKYSFAVKAVADGVLEVRAIPFDKQDSDRQWFDNTTDIMPDQFQTPVIMYQHSVSQGAKGFQGKPEVIGKAISGSLQKRNDGWYIRVALNLANKLAKGIWEAAQKGMVAVSSGSVAHLARLWKDGKLIPYDKGIPGKIGVWPFAELSLWEKGNGNFNASNPYAVALPVIKAIYRDAGLKFPDISAQSTPPRSEAHRANVRPEIVGMEKRLDQLYKQLKDRGKAR